MVTQRDDENPNVCPVKFKLTCTSPSSLLSLPSSSSSVLSSSTMHMTSPFHCLIYYLYFFFLNVDFVLFSCTCLICFFHFVFNIHIVAVNFFLHGLVSLNFT